MAPRRHVFVQLICEDEDSIATTNAVIYALEQGGCSDVARQFEREVKNATYEQVVATARDYVREYEGPYTDLVVNIDTKYRHPFYQARKVKDALIWGGYPNLARWFAIEAVDPYTTLLDVIQRYVTIGDGEDGDEDDDDWGIAE